MNQGKVKQTLEIAHCYHCGNDCSDEGLCFENKSFCCTGCKNVYQLLTENNLGTYYKLETSPGSRLENGHTERFAYLGEEKIISQLIDFKDEHCCRITLYIPAIHCSSCIWLLEHLYRVDSAIHSSRSDFLKKQVSLSFDHNKLSLRALVELLAGLGYEPLISLQDMVKKGESPEAKRLISKLAVAGFCFGNIMLLSFPEYLGIDSSDAHYQGFFAMMNILLALPVFFYSGWGYFESACRSLRKGILNIDFPLALGILVLFARSIIEIATRSGAGYLDTLAGLVFFLLVGRWFQNKTFTQLSFDRDYKSYFPVAVTLLTDGKEKPVPISDLRRNDRILVRNNELIPADSILLKGDGLIDYSFVTGEAAEVEKILGELVYAGGRQKGQAIEMEVIKAPSQSYLTQLWNHHSFTKKEGNRIKTFSDTVSRYFSIGLLIVALSSFFWWMPSDIGRAWSALTAVLIIACPCALALSTPFTMGNALRILGRNKFYLKNSSVVEQLAKVDSFVFDKTGTITENSGNKIAFYGTPLTNEEKIILRSATRNSTHPLSRMIYASFPEAVCKEVSYFKELPGKGIEVMVGNIAVKLGSTAFFQLDKLFPAQPALHGEVHLSISGKYRGFFGLSSSYREGLSDVVNDLKKDAGISLISGDNDKDRERLGIILGGEVPLKFNMSPEAKLNYIEEMQGSGRYVAMIGDGLNDSGALKSSDMGIAVTDDINNFTPASDGILHASGLKKLPDFRRFCKGAVNVVRVSFVISMIYNVVGLSYAVKGELSPLIAAVLMPLSTVTVISFTSISTRLLARRRKLL